MGQYIFEEAIEKFDYVFTDAMTFTDEKGRRNRIWIKKKPGLTTNRHL